MIFYKKIMNDKERSDLRIGTAMGFPSEEDQRVCLQTYV
jgi:hypothetical protein